MLANADQYWEIGMYGLRCHTVKKTIFRNPFHCRYKELNIFIIAYFLLHFPPYCVLIFVCNINFEEIFLYSMMLNPYLLPLVTTI